MVAGQVFDDDPVVVDEGVFAVPLDRKTVCFGRVGQHKAGAVLIVFAQEINNGGSGPFKSNLNDVKRLQ